MYSDRIGCRLKDIFDGQGGLGHFSLEMSPAEPEHPGSRRLIDHWDSKRAADGWVHRAAIEAKGLLEVLPNLFILEPRAGDWVVRLVGTGIVDRTGYETTRKSLSQIYEPAIAQALIKAYDRAAATGQTVAFKGRLLGFGIDHAWAENIALPIRAREGDAVHILGGIFFHDQAGPADRPSEPAEEEVPAPVASGKSSILSNLRRCLPGAAKARSQAPTA